MQMTLRAFCACFFLLVSLRGAVEAQNSQVVIVAYPNSTAVEQGTTLALVCRVVGMPSTSVLSYQWTCPGGYCDAGGVDPEWAARIQQGNILVVNVRNDNDRGDYNCTVMDGTRQLGTATYMLTITDGLSLLNEDGGLRVFFPRNSFVTNTKLTHTTNPLTPSPEEPSGNDHIVCYGGNPQAKQVTWHNSSGEQLVVCHDQNGPAPCEACGGRCHGNGGVGVDPPLNGHTDIHVYTDSPSYVNQDLECRVSSGPSAFIGVYLVNGDSSSLEPPSSVTYGVTSNTTMSISWSQVSNATGYYVSYQRQDLGTPPVVTPQYERIVGRDNTNVTLSGLEPGTTYRIRVWSTDGTSVSNKAREIMVPSVDTGTGTANTLVTIAAIIPLLLAIGGIVIAIIVGILFWKRKKKAYDKQQASANSCHYYKELEQCAVRQYDRPLNPTCNVKPATESDYSYAAAQGISEQLEQVGANEATYTEIKENEPHPCQLPTSSKEALPKPTQADNDHMYAAVAKKQKLPITASEDMSKSAPAAQISVPPAKPSPYKTAGKGSKTGMSTMNDCGAFDGFLKQVESMHTQGKASFEDEFNSVEKKTASSTAVAELNNERNRYKNIFPYDSSRVVLSVPNTSGTDYINASFVNGYIKNDSYIASQAPVPGNVDDFWQMIWDQRMNIVVMLTRTMEGGKRKSEDYYSECPGDAFSSGRFQIRTLSLKYHVDYEVRVLEAVQTSDPSQTRTLDHYLFTGWPDYGVPKYPTSLIRMLYHVRDARVSDVPLLVHCSAGVGRTGTFIALDITLDHMKAEKTVDIKGTLEKMRERRMHMIQTAEQYLFVYDAVRELLLLGDTSIKASGLRSVISQLKNKTDGKNSYQQQFASLTTITQESANDERVEEDPKTIRYPDRAPFQNKHMFVYNPDSGRSVVINASLVDGYHAPHAFIAAQSPMQASLSDFWTLIAEKKVQTVLLLCQLVEESQDTCYQFWPPAEGGTLNVGQMNVTLLKKKKTSDFDSYKMTIQKTNLTQDVTLLHYKQWPEKKRPKSASFLSLFTSAQKLQQPHSDRPIAVACNDGLGRTGTFIAIWSLIEQMKAEGQIDVVGTIKSIRTQRPGAVPYLDQFMYCHDLLLEYVDSFEGYSNFNQ